MSVKELIGVLNQSGIDFAAGFKKNNTVVSQWILKDDYYANFLKELEKSTKEKHDNTKFKNIDLPWFGANFFNKNTDRIAIIAQDAIRNGTNVDNYTLQGSVTFWAHLSYQEIRDNVTYNKITNDLKTNGLPGYPYNSWWKTQEIISAAGRDNVYLTDAGKCFTKNNGVLRNDSIHSNNLLKQEITSLNINKIIVLGSSAFNMLASYTGKRLIFGNYARNIDTFEVSLNGHSINCLVSYFPGGKNRSLNGIRSEYHSQLLDKIKKF